MKKSSIVFLSFAMSLIYILFTASSGGRATIANVGNTGAPSETQLCSSCHNSGTGFGTVTPTIQVFENNTTTQVTSYVPGATYDIRVTVNASAGTPAGYGFQLTCLTTPGNVPLAGYSNLASNVKQKLITTGTFAGRTYTEHQGVTNNNQFNFKWTAPATGQGNITFYASGNAVNANNGTSGDKAGNTSLILTQAALPINLSATTMPVSCNGGTNGNINLTATGGVSPYTYLWSNGATTQDLSNLPAGTYTVTVTDAVNTQTTGSYVVGQPSSLSHTFVVTQPSCSNQNNGSISIQVSGGTPPYSYLWSNGATTTVNSNLLGGTYSVTVTDANNCVLTASQSLNIPLIPNFSYTTESPSCFGTADGSITVSLVGGGENFIIEWETGAVGNSLNNVSSGSYELTATGVNSGCVFSYMTELESPSALIISSQSIAPLCNGETGTILINVSGGTSPYTTNQSDLTDILSGTYSIEVIDANGCIAETSATLSSPSPLSFSTSIEPILCFGSADGVITISPVGGTSPYSILWSDGNTNFNRVELVGGEYSATIYDANNCEAIVEVTIEEPAPFNTFVNSTPILCFGQTSTISVEFSGGVAPYTNPYTTLPAGFYELEFTDANGCSTQNSLTIYQPSPLNVTSNNPVISCEGGTAFIEYVVTGGTTPYLFAEPVEVNAPGIYPQTIIDANGCSNQISTIVASESGLLATANVMDVTCFDACNGSIDLMVSGGIAPYSFSWNNESTQEDQLDLCAGTYSVVITDSGDCLFNAQFTVGTPEPLVVGVNSSSIDCFGETAFLTADVSGGTEPYSYSWTGGLNDQTIEVNAGDYSVEVFDANQCSGFTIATVTEPPLLEVSADIVEPSCYGENSGSITLDVNGGSGEYSYDWIAGNNNSSLSVAAGEYVVTVSDGNDCSTVYTAIVNQPDALLLSNVVTENISCFGLSDGSISVQAIGGTGEYSYLWNNNIDGPALSDLGIGTYTLVVTDESNCSNTTTFEITQPDALEFNQITITPITTDNNGFIDIEVVGGTAPYTYNWNEGSTTNDIEIVTEGEYFVTVLDANGCTLESGALFVATGLHESTINVNLFPNPALDQVTFVSDRVWNFVQIFDSFGKIVYTDSVRSYQTSIDVSQWSSGLYQVIFESPQGRWSAQFIKE